MASGRMGKLAEKVALITGGSRGIGKAIAMAYAAEGAKNEEDRFRAGHGTLPIDLSVEGFFLITSGWTMKLMIRPSSPSGW